MSTWVLADPHAGADPSADAALLRMLDHAIERGVDLLVMGDLFVAWIAVERYFTELQHAVIDRLVRLRSGGNRVRFVVGNRDYLSERLVGRAFDVVYPEPILIDLDGIATFVAHGDRLNPDDRPYLAWYRLSRSSWVNAVLGRLPGPIGRTLAAGVERRMRGVNQAYKGGTLPMDGIAALARRAKDAGAQRVLLGHFHEPTTLDLAVPVHIAPGWCERPVVVDGITLQPCNVTMRDGHSR